MNISKNTLILTVIITIAAIFRFYHLGTVPNWFFNDEAAAGYNAYSILKTGKDEFGVPFPIVFESFGEGKLPLYIYEHIPAIAIFGLNEFAVRFTPALLATLTVLATYFLVKEILLHLNLKKNKANQDLKTWLPLLSATALAVMPWHIHFSRGIFGQESLFWVTLGVYFSLKALRLDQLKLWVYSFIFFSVALLTYHAPKAFVPLWIASLLSIYFFQKRKLIPTLKIAGLGLLLSGSVWLLMTFHPLGMARAADMSVFSLQSGVYAKLHESIRESAGEPTQFNRAMHNKLSAYGHDILQRYFSHFDPTLLFFEGDSRPRYRSPHVGQLLLISLPFLLVGIYHATKRKLWPVFLFLAFAPVSAALSFETPSSVRAIFMVVPLAIFLGLGVMESYRWLEKQFKNKHFVYGISMVIFFAFIYNLTFYTEAYFVHSQIHFPYHSQYGYKQLVQKINEYTPNYNKIILADRAATPYIFLLFYNQYDPAQWQPHSHDDITPDENFSFIHIGKFENIDIVEECPEKAEEGVLYICRTEPEQPDNSKIIDRLDYVDNTPNFYFFEKQ